MLLSIRDKMEGWIKWIIVVILIVVFSLWGISYYIESDHADMNAVATVNGKPVSQTLFQSIYESRLQDVIHAGGSPDVKTLQQEALEATVDRTLMLDAAAQLKMTVPQQAVTPLIAQMKAFQQSGQFSPELFQSLLAERGMTPDQFVQSMQRQLTLTQFQSGMIGSPMVLPAEITQLYQSMMQTRDIQVIAFPNTQSINTIHVSESQIEAYYHAHSDLFMAPQTVQVSYLLLSREALAHKTGLTGTALDAAFESDVNRLSTLTSNDPSSLLMAAKALDTPVMLSPYFTQTGVTEGDPGVARYANVQRAAFSDFVLKDHMNSDLVMLPDHQVLVLRMVNQVPAHEKPLDQVSAQIRAIVLQKLAIQKAHDAAEAYQAQLIADPSMLKDAAKTHAHHIQYDRGVSIGDTNIPLAVRMAAFRQFVPAPGQWVSQVSQDDQAAYVVVLDAVHRSNALPTDKDRTEIQGLIHSARQEMALVDLVQSLRSHAKIVSHLNRVN